MGMLRIAGLLAAVALAACSESAPDIDVVDSYDMGTVVKGEFAVADLTVRNLGDGPLTVVAVSTSCGCTTRWPRATRRGPASSAGSAGSPSQCSATRRATARAARSAAPCSEGSSIERSGALESHAAFERNLARIRRRSARSAVAVEAGEDPAVRVVVGPKGASTVSAGGRLLGKRRPRMVTVRAARRRRGGDEAATVRATEGESRRRIPPR